MFSWSALVTAGLAVAGAHGTPVEVARRATPTVYLAGDSTMAKTGNPHMGKQLPSSNLSHFLLLT